MNLFFLGSLVSPDKLKELPSASVAGNKMQYNLLKHLSKKDVDLTVFSFKVHAKFPKEKKILVLSEKETMPDGFVVNYLPYVNLPILKEITLMLAYWWSLFKVVKEDSVLFSYNLFVYQSFAFNFFRKKVKGKCVCLLADLSAGSSKKGLLGKIARWAFDSYHLHSLRKCKYFVALNEYALRLYTRPEKFIIVDGGVEPSEYPTESLTWDEKKKNILYSGALVDYSGVMNLVDAMKYVDSSDVELHIYGNGPLVNEILRKCEENKKIKYCGAVSNSEMLTIQRKSWLLVNPRPVEDDTSKVTFPSKIFEYMMSERPVLSTRLNGFSKDYDDLIYWIEDDSAKGIAYSINSLVAENTFSINEKAKKAKEYMLNNKTWNINANFVYEFLRKIESISL